MTSENVLEGIRTELYAIRVELTTMNGRMGRVETDVARHEREIDTISDWQIGIKAVGKAAAWLIGLAGISNIVIWVLALSRISGG